MTTGSWRSAIRGLLARETQNCDQMLQCPAVEEREAMTTVWMAASAAPWSWFEKALWVALSKGAKIDYVGSAH
jgi:hypothetical protein